MMYTVLAELQALQLCDVEIVDIESKSELTKRYKIKQLPSFLIEKNNEVVNLISGVQDINNLKNALKKQERVLTWI